MHEEYWFLRREAYQPLLEGFAITEAEYRSAMEEIANLFPAQKSTEYYRAKLKKLGSLTHFDLIPYPNQKLQYNPVPILINVNSAGALSQLLYLGLALHDFKNGMPQTKAFTDLTSEENYRGALFEIEVGAELVRSGLKPAPRKTSPDYIIQDPLLGVEATTLDVPLRRAIAERLFTMLAFLDFRHLSIELTAKGEHNPEEMVHDIRNEVERLLSAGELELIRPHYRIRHDLIESGERTVTVTSGKYQYEAMLSHMIGSRLQEKEQNIRKWQLQISCIAALDIRSLIVLPIDPQSEYERQLAERNSLYFERLRVFRQKVVSVCQSFVGQSPLIKATLLWQNKRTKAPADQVHRRYLITLVTAEGNIEVNKQNLSAELLNVVK